MYNPIKNIKKTVAVLSLFYFLFFAYETVSHVHSDFKGHDDCQICSVISLSHSVSLNVPDINFNIILSEFQIKTDNRPQVEFFSVFNFNIRPPPSLI
ncbi:MAG: hypothetical protein PHR82_07945 [Endomicrobiaceae bacterium]|nr:hypothetical protein [Endomicrobiaceae bacterium]